jgi:dTDP-4-amino-4,6-dideoxygalactose transaminase
MGNTGGLRQCILPELLKISFMKNIYVTKTFLPKKEEYQAYLDQIWSSDQLTNQGPLLQQLELQLKQVLTVDNFHFVSNGTTALQIALRALGITEGEVITTPFTYVATTSAIMWEGCTPVYVDIEPDTFCIDPKKIEAAITSKTKAIMPVHVFGNPCDIEAIDAIAKKHNLKVIYDAAHAFGVTVDGRSLLNYGDISICSFHATKPFHTIEGGCLVVKDKLVSDKVELIKRFGHNGDEHYVLGINGKANEFQAAMGLCNLKYFQEFVAARKKISELYDELLDKRFKRPAKPDNLGHNYSYYPVLLKDEAELRETVSQLGMKGIFPRRYFYPSLNKLPYINREQTCEVSEDIASRILCLPLYYGLEDSVIKEISEVMNG